MTTYPLPTLGPTVDANGISAPSYEDILLSLQASYQAIYGSDVYLGADSQDGQWLAIQAKAYSDSNQAAIATYNQFSPASAQGVGLSSVVKINGIARLVPSFSTAPILIVGQAGTPLLNVVVGDNQSLGTEWLLPGSITIPLSGEITQTATCTTAGSITAEANTLTRIVNPTTGWQTANNPQAATPGNPEERDATLRQRQAASTSLPANTLLQSIVGNIENLGGVVAVSYVDNDSGTTDVNGVPAHSIALVVQGGNAQAIADVIGEKKDLGTGTFGNTSETYVDPFGISHTVEFSIPVQKTIDVTLTITALAGYSSVVGDEIKSALAGYVSGLGLGVPHLYISRLYGPALLQGPYASTANGVDPSTYELNLGTVKAAIHPGSPGTVDLNFAYNEVAICGTSNVTLTVI